MNKTRRHQLELIVEQSENQIAELEATRDEEQEAFDNMPVSIQYSEKGDIMQENIDDIDSAISDLENVIESINDIINK